MKRLFPRAISEALGLLGGLLVLLSEGCSPNNSVKPGAPVLLKLTIVENGATTTDITADTTSCKAGIEAGDACRLVDNVVEGEIVDSADPLCLLGEAVWCRCAGDASMMEMGTWNCDPFSPLSYVVATFDRLLDTVPLDPGTETSRDDIASLTATPMPPIDVTPAVDYSATGNMTGGVFNLYGKYFYGNFRSEGPSLGIMSNPAQADDATISIVLDSTKVRAKDGKTAFVGMGFLADGALKFKTAAFSASITTPVAPPPAVDPDAGAGDTDGGATDGGATDGGATDGGATDGGATDGDALADASLPEAGREAGVIDATDEAAPPAPPVPGEPVPSDMNKGEVTIAFNNLVDKDVLGKIKITVDGAPFTAFKGPDPDTDFPLSQVKLTPTIEWEMGKTYVVTVEGSVTDLVGSKLGATVAAAFTMAN